MRELRTDKVAIPTRFARGAVVAVTCCVLIAGCKSNASGAPPSHKAPTTTTTTLPRLHQPTDTKPMTILDVGDSLGEDLGLGLGYTMGTNPLVHLIQAAHGDSGLARPDFYVFCAVAELSSLGDLVDDLAAQLRLGSAVATAGQRR